MRRFLQSQASERMGQRGLVTCLGVAVLLSACSAKGGPVPSPTSSGPTVPDTAGHAAAALAAGLSHEDVSSVVFAQATGAQVQSQFAPLVAGLDTKPTVTVASVEQSGQRATAKLHVSWTFPGVLRPWSYDSSAALNQDNEEWQTTWTPALVAPGLNGVLRLVETRTPAARGQVLGAGGDVIVRPRPVVRIGIDKTQVTATRSATSAARLAKLVHVDVKNYVAAVKGAGGNDFVEAITFRATAAERPADRAVYAIDGAVAISGQAMLAPSRTFAHALLGSVGPATKEIVDASQGQVAAGDEVGRSGLQRRYDPQLRGTPGVTVRLVAASGNGAASSSPTPSATPTPKAPTPQTVFSSKPVAGKDLTLTLDIALQNLAERVLARTKPAAALVAIRPSTGQVLAVANGPGSGEASAATTGRFPPGSTFKVASALALLRSGLTPRTPVTCPATVTVDGKTFKNYSDYPSSHLGHINLLTALAQSCNTAFIGQRGRLRGSDLADAAGSLGLGIDYDVGFGSFFGAVPSEATATGRAAAMIGQGQVLASPLAMAAVAASVAAGHTVVPSLVMGVKAPSKASPLTTAEAGQLRDMMAAVVSSGSGHVLRALGGPTVIAKTGTAEFGSKPPFRTHAWMIAAHGDLAVAVFVATGSTGSHTAGPLLKRFLADAR